MTAFTPYMQALHKNVNLAWPPICWTLPGRSWGYRQNSQPSQQRVKRNSGRGWHTRGTSVRLRSSKLTENTLSVEHGGRGGDSGAGGGEGFWRWWNSDGGASPKIQLLCLLLSCQSWEAHAAGRRRQGHRQQRSPWSDNRDVDQYATHLTQLAWPVLQNLGFSGAVGLVCAVAFKAIGRIVAVGVGTMFAAIQLLAYRGYITVEWSRIHEEVLRICDVDKDGRFEATDLRTTLASLLAAASQGLPSVSGFCLGFGLGLRF